MHLILHEKIVDESKFYDIMSLVCVISAAKNNPISQKC